MSKPIRASALVRSLEADNDCLRYRVAELENELRMLKHAVGLPANIERPFGLTLSENVIFTLLMSREFVSRATMEIALYANRPDFEPGFKAIDVFVAKIRKKIFPHAAVKNDRDVGWFISREHKARIREQLNGQRKDAA